MHFYNSVLAKTGSSTITMVADITIYINIKETMTESKNIKIFIKYLSEVINIRDQKVNATVKTATRFACLQVI